MCDGSHGPTQITASHVNHIKDRVGVARLWYSGSMTKGYSGEIQDSCTLKISFCRFRKKKINRRTCSHYKMLIFFVHKQVSIHLQMSKVYLSQTGSFPIPPSLCMRHACRKIDSFWFWIYFFHIVRNRFYN